MENFDRKKHWEHIYQTKELNEVSWYQPIPTTSLEHIERLNIPKDARIIDVGGGDSYLVDNLLELGYTDLTVLDISEAALERAKKRLDEKASNAKWITTDAATFEPTEKYDLWHDRAVFHFLRDKEEIKHYVQALESGIKPGGYLIIGTFSNEGPLKCSGLEIQQYSEDAITQLLQDNFEKVSCEIVDHQTPFDTSQRFLFCCFKRI